MVGDGDPKVVYPSFESVNESTHPASFLSLVISFKPLK